VLSCAGDPHPFSKVEAGADGGNSPQPASATPTLSPDFLKKACELPVKARVVTLGQ